MPGSSASDWAKPTRMPERGGELVEPAVVVARLLVLATAEYLADQHDEAVREQEERDGDRRGEQLLDARLEQDAEHADGDRSGDQQPPGALVGVVGEAAAHDAGDERADDADPFVAVEDDERQGRPEVQHDDEREKRIGAFVDVPVQQRGDEHGVAEAADREQFADALQHREQHRLHERHEASVRTRGRLSRRREDRPGG